MKTIQDYSQNTVRLVLLRRNWIRIFIGIAVMLAMVYLGFVIILPIDHDEVEHAHVAYKMLRGKIPYRDFYQNHLPTYWLVVMQWIRAFPFSINAILAGRAVNLLALGACWLLGFRLLGSIRGGRTRFALSIYTIAILSLASEMQFHAARPDPLMTLFASTALFLIPLQGYISIGRALCLGILLGFSISISSKAIPMVLVVPGLIVLHCIRERRIEPAKALLPYAAGVILSLLPTALWVFRNGLFDAFCFDVFGLNGALKKSWHTASSFLLIPIYLSSILGVIAQLGIYRRGMHRKDNAPLTLALAMVAGLALAVLSRHIATYNLQILLVPMAIGFVFFVLHLCLHLRSKGYQLLLCAALTGYPLIHVKEVLVNYKNTTNALPQRDLQRLMDLAKPGNKSCAAFSPSHPVFCDDIGGLSNGWDLIFAQSIRDPQQLERFHRIWQDGIKKTISQRPDIILRRSPYNSWEGAASSGLITSEDLAALDALRALYEVHKIGPCEAWLRRPQ